MTKRIYVIDTGYLDEFYQVDSYSDPGKYKKIKSLFQMAKDQAAVLCIPVTVIFELTNHIALDKNEKRRTELAGKLAGHIQSSVKNNKPYTITPCTDFSSIETVAENLLEFSKTYAQKGIGLTDTSVLLEAQKRRKKYPSDYLVHIWTTDKKLKLEEPDTEQNAFV